MLKWTAENLREKDQEGHLEIKIKWIIGEKIALIVYVRYEIIYDKKLHTGRRQFNILIVFGYFRCGSHLLFSIEYCYYFYDPLNLRKNKHATPIVIDIGLCLVFFRIYFFFFLHISFKKDWCVFILKNGTQY